MNALSHITSIVQTRAHQAEIKMREGIGQQAQTLQKTVDAARNAANTSAYKVDISPAAMKLAARRG
ncbi:MAG: hypothetical protein HQM03_16995 [Magnetococcales bacterium]|nr:hypothetical protein [Magnetococcales bacterium]